MVVTIKDMHFLLNLSHKVASTGRFQTFCIRFSEQFSLRQKIWTLDPKKHKLLNFGTITRGTFRLCIATKKRFSEKNPTGKKTRGDFHCLSCVCVFYTVAVGEKLLCGFQWDMSGIDVHANTDIGHHISTLVRTMTTIASDLEGKETVKSRRASGASFPSPKSQSARHVRKNPSTSKFTHKRSMSVHQRPSQADTNYKNALEQELAKQTRKVQQLRYSGAPGESLRIEEAILRSTEQELAKTVQRMFKHPRTGLSLQMFNQIFNPRSTSHERIGGRLSSSRTRLLSLSESQEPAAGSPPSSPVPPHNTPPLKSKGLGHRRYKSDLTGMRAGALSPATSSEKEDEEEEEEGFGEALLTEPAPHKEAKEGFSLPTIDLEFDVTVNVDRGKIVLRTEER